MIKNLRSSNLLGYTAWTIALASMAGSLFFSEVMQFAPCVLCWYQRIAMYPLHNHRRGYFAGRSADENVRVTIQHNWVGHLHLSQLALLRGNSCRRHTLHRRYTVQCSSARTAGFHNHTANGAGGISNHYFLFTVLFTKGIMRLCEVK